MKILPNRIGVSNNLYLNNINQYEIIENLCRDFQYVEIELEGAMRELCGKDITNLEPARKIKEIVNKYNTKISLHAPYKKVDYLYGNDDTKQLGVDILKRSLEFASIIGAERFTLHPGFKFIDKDNPVARKNGMDRIIEVAYELFDETKRLKTNIDLCLENTGNQRPFLVLTTQEELYVFNNSPLKLTLDVVHIASFAPDQEEVFNRISNCAKFVKNVHLGDMIFPEHFHLPLGEGNFDFMRVISTLNESGYDGPFIIEETGKGFYGDDYVKKAKEFISQLLNQN